MFSSHFGELAALGTAMCWTVTSMAFEAAGKRIGSMAVNLIRLVMAFVFLTLYCTYARGMALPLDASGHAWFWLLISGLIGFTVGDLCLFRAFVLVGARVSMLIMSLVPLMTAIIGWLWMHESLTWQDWAGMGITMLGVGWVVVVRQEKKGRPQTTPATGGIVLALLGALGQAVGLVLSKHGMGRYDAFSATQIRVIAGIVGFVLLFSIIRWWPRVAAGIRDRGALARTGLGAFFGPFLGVSLSLLAVQHTETGVAATIMSIVPVLIIPPAILVFHERVGIQAVLGAGVAVAGVALLFLG